MGRSKVVNQDGISSQIQGKRNFLNSLTKIIVTFDVRNFGFAPSENTLVIVIFIHL